MIETTRKLCLRSAKEQTGTRLATAVAMGSGSAAFSGLKAATLISMRGKMQKNVLNGGVYDAIYIATL